MLDTIVTSAILELLIFPVIYVNWPTKPKNRRLWFRTRWSFLVKIESEC
jgi:hypothetical protein